MFGLMILLILIFCGKSNAVGVLLCDCSSKKSVQIYELSINESRRMSEETRFAKNENTRFGQYL